MFTCGVFIDLEKAFDAVNHEIIWSKLKHYGITGGAKKWLSNRHLSISLNGVSSSHLPVTCGVPQGSILGPLLFLVYINDMNTAMEFSTTYHISDDTNLLYSHKSIDLLRKQLNKDLALLYNVLCANCLCLMLEKQNLLSFNLQVAK